MLSKDEIKNYLLSSGEKQKELHSNACNIRNKYLSDYCSIRAVIEITNDCKGQCKYCEMGFDNHEIDRYTLNCEQILNCIDEIQSLGIKTVMLQGAENLDTTRIIIDILQKFDTNIEIILCLGNKKESEYLQLYNNGAKGYILKLETTDIVLHNELRGKPLYERIDCLNSLRKIGYNVGTGIIFGLPGQSNDSIVEDLFFIGQQIWSMCSVSPFIPPSIGMFSNYSSGDLNRTLNIISILRLMQPTAMIPTVSALNIIEQNAQIKGLNAGANFMTVNYTPNGYQENYRIYNKQRTNNIVKMQDVKERSNKASMQVSLNSTLGPTILNDERELIKSFFDEKWLDSSFELQNPIYKFENPLLEYFLENSIHGRVCDIGCGDGRYAIRFANRGDSIMAIDFSENAIIRLKGRANKLNVENQIYTLILDVRNLKFQDDMFDIVLLANMLHYLSPLEITGLLSKIYRVMNVGGTLYIGLETDIVMKYEEEKYFTFATQYNHCFKQLLEIVSAAGFQVDENKLTSTYIDDDFILPVVISSKLKTTSKIYNRTFKLMEVTATK